jgi:hypothetical protein
MDLHQNGIPLPKTNNTLSIAASTISVFSNMIASRIEVAIVQSIKKR